MTISYLKNIADSILEFVVVILITIGIIFGFKISYFFFIMTASAAIFMIVYTRIKTIRSIRKQKKKIKDGWGEKQKRERSFSDIKELFLFIRESSDNHTYSIDDATWSDLDMDFVFTEADHTISVAGSQYLYHLLRTPVFDSRSLMERACIANKLLKDKDTAQLLQYHLLGISDDKDVSFKIFREDLKTNRKLLILYKILSYIIIPEAVLIIFSPQIGIILLVITIFINFIIYISNKYKIFEEISEFKYIQKLISCAKEIISIDTKDIDLGQREIKDLILKLKKISRNLSLINFGTGITKTEIEAFIEIINVIFLIEPIVFYNTTDLINKHKNDLRKLHMLIGRIDALIAIASYKKSLNYYSEPKLIPYSDNNKEKYYIETENIYHPLLKKPVSNSFRFQKKGIVITGSNASGKSTFLRVLGINAIFAQSMFFTFSTFYQSYYFKIFTSIGTTDNVREGDSYFMAEAKSLKRILDETNDTVPVMCILDEIFRGTNTVERISAGIEVLKYLTDRNFCTIIATHDLELADLSRKFCKNYHFREEIIGDDIKFNYILHEGISKTKNALKILKNLDYPMKIYKGAVNFSKESYSSDD